MSTCMLNIYTIDSQTNLAQTSHICWAYNYLQNILQNIRLRLDFCVETIGFKNTATTSYNNWAFRYKQDVEYHDVSFCNQRIETGVYGYNVT